MTSICGLSAPLDWPKPGQEMPSKIFGPFSLDRMQTYALVSGDDNPLHSDATLAAQAGLEASPVHGMFMLSCCEPAILSWRQDVMIARLSAKFLLPVLTGQSVAISGRVLRVQLENKPQMLLRVLARIVSDSLMAGANRDLAILAEATLHYRP